MIFSILAALAASVFYGISDFLGAVAAMRLRVVPTTTISYVAATAVLAIGVIATGGVWSTGVLVSGAIAGVCAVVGFVSFYAAMSRGPMSLTSPLVAVLSAAVPILVAVLLGESLPVLGWAGVALALISALLIASQPRQGRMRVAPSTLALAAVSGVSLGAAVVALDQAPQESGLIAALVQMVIGLILLLMIVLLTSPRLTGPVLRSAATSRAIARVRDAFDRLGSPVTDESVRHRRRATAAAVGAGSLLGLSNALILAALHSGSLAVVSVLIALYPLGTIVLARIVMNERITGMQMSGVGLAIVSSAVIGLSLG